MPLLAERRRRPRREVSCPAVLRDQSGRVLLRGRAADISPLGIRILGEGGGALREGQFVWVELTVPAVTLNRTRHRTVKMRGNVRRIEVMGNWRDVIVVIFESEFPNRLLGSGA